MPGGISVGDISQGTSAHMNNPLVFSLIKSNNWNYLVLQDNQGRFCLGYGQFPSTSLVIEGHLKIRDSLLFYHPCSHLIWFAGFGPKNGYPPYGNTGQALIDSIYQNYQFLNDTAHQIIAPIGPAFIHIMNNYSAIDLWDTDAVHPSLYGSFLTSCVIYSTIFKSSPVNSSFNPGFSSVDENLMKNIAFHTTFDSSNYTGLALITPPIIQSSDTLSVNNFLNNQWIFNNSTCVSTNPEVTINQQGYYYAVVTDTNGCEYTTWENFYFPAGINENISSDLFSLNVFPNPITQNVMIIDFHSSSNENTEASIINSNGQLIKKILLVKGFNTLQLNVTDGIYYFKTGNLVKKIIVHQEK